MQKLKLQINAGLDAQYCQTTGSASRRVLTSTAQLPRPFEAWHARKGSPVGTAGCPCWVQIRISSSATPQLPTPFSQEGTRRHKDQKQESGGLRRSRLCLSRACPWAGCSTLPTQILHLKRALLIHTRSPFWLSPQNEGLFSELLYYGHNPWQRDGLLSMLIGGWGRRPVWKQRSLLSGPSVGSSRGRFERGGEFKVLKTD